MSSQMTRGHSPRRRRRGSSRLERFWEAHAADLPPGAKAIVHCEGGRRFCPLQLWDIQTGGALRSSSKVSLNFRSVMTATSILYSARRRPEDWTPPSSLPAQLTNRGRWSVSCSYFRPNGYRLQTCCVRRWRRCPRRRLLLAVPEAVSSSAR